jgi:hypothetical protein
MGVGTIVPCSRKSKRSKIFFKLGQFFFLHIIFAYNNFSKI